MANDLCKTCMFAETAEGEKIITKDNITIHLRNSGNDGIICTNDYISLISIGSSKIFSCSGYKKKVDA